jgi:hypothetical protein
MELGKKWPVNLACDFYLHINCRDILHTANWRHGTDGFTSPQKEGMLWFFSPEKSDGFSQVRTRNLGTRSQHANQQTTEAAQLTTK